MSATPISSTNAIDAAAFIVLFNRPFSEREEKRLLALKEVLKSDLPDFSRTTKITLKSEPGKPPEHTVQESGLRLQKFEPSGKVGWILNIVENQMVVTCHAYNRWNNVWDRTNKYIQSALKLLDLQSLSVQACMLQVVDRFTEKSTTDYNIHSVFDKVTPYLTAKSITSGKLWHVHQGWFDNKSADEKILNILNLGTNEDGGKIITTIDHSLQFQFSNSKQAKKFFDKNREYEKAFFSLHESNKNVIKSILNQKQCKAIGLV